MTQPPYILGKPYNLGPFRHPNFAKTQSQAYVKLTQQGVEVINTGAPASQDVRLTQQGAEVINTGNPTLQKVRLTQQGLEVIVTFGTPPVTGPGKKGGPPGKGKQLGIAAYIKFHARLRRAKYANTWRFTNDAQVFIPDPYMISMSGAQAQANAMRTVETTRTIFRD